ncbi:hypothetical protein [Brunnivagina elsteri]|uniref:Uncharacterized protein n=1 Tax=Brunnivagina elsteri CCALA 953 TaxID=987040 RepID=A0A2A2TL16_9CYAN|nr:hypothetical protein [Calothrix elsteri]PAX56141.1 hypothetical protein CK510_10580 [Calothrix elsteri CCALA 953]
MSYHYQQKITSLWNVFLLGTLFHTQLGLMPLFHGLSIANPNLHANEFKDVSSILWLMLLFFVIPILAIIGTNFTNSQAYKTAHFYLTILYSILNSLHLILDLGVKPIIWSQITLMLILLLVGLLLNFVSYQWMGEGTHKKQFHVQRD